MPILWCLAEIKAIEWLKAQIQENFTKVFACCPVLQTKQGSPDRWPEALLCITECIYTLFTRRIGILSRCLVAQHSNVRLKPKDLFLSLKWKISVSLSSSFQCIEQLFSIWLHICTQQLICKVPIYLKISKTESKTQAKNNKKEITYCC